MICTSSHKNCCSDKYTTYSISGNRGRDAGYTGKCYPALAPKLVFWKIWHENIGIIPEEENNRYYIEQYYQQVLSKLDPEQVCRDLDGSILLCYEDNMDFCHRHIVTAWLELLLEVKTKEVKINDYNVEEVERPTYIKQYLSEVMRDNLNMRGFKSLRALYLFEKGEKLEKLADELEEKTGQDQGAYRQQACFYRCDADEAEENYNKRLSEKVKKIGKKTN